MSPPVFNIVVTRDGFWLLRFFVCSLVHNSEAQFRLVANHCQREELALMNDYAMAHPDQVIEVLDVSSDKMIGHGDALDLVRAARDDGELFCFVDPDIKATGPFLPAFLEVLRDYSAVTAGKAVWKESSVLPEALLGTVISGGHFFHPNGFTYGSPHMAMYRRANLDDTCDRWGVGFGTAGPELTDAIKQALPSVDSPRLELCNAAKERLASAGHLYRIYDTGKALNILLQLDGYSLRHIDPEQLIHIGGMSQFLAPSTRDDMPTHVRMGGKKPRYFLACYTAALLRSLVEGTMQPDPPSQLDETLEEGLTLVRREVIDLVDRYRECATGRLGPAG